MICQTFQSSWPLRTKVNWWLLSSKFKQEALKSTKDWPIMSIGLPNWSKQSPHHLNASLNVKADSITSSTSWTTKWMSKTCTTSYSRGQTSTIWKRWKLVWSGWTSWLTAWPFSSQTSTTTTNNTSCCRKTSRTFTSCSCRLGEKVALRKTPCSLPRAWTAPHARRESHKYKDSGQTTLSGKTSQWRKHPCAWQRWAKVTASSSTRASTIRVTTTTVLRPTTCIRQCQTQDTWSGATQSRPWSSGQGRWPQNLQIVH